MRFVITQYTNLNQEQNSWIIALSNELESFFENRAYGEDLKELYFGVITVKPEFDQFFKARRPRYRPGERTSFVDGIEINSNNCAELDCKIEFGKISELDKEALVELVCEEILTASNSLTRLSKLKRFDFKTYQSDLENYLIEKKYIKEK
ncbi:hypothetical protein EYY60_06345 [Flavobacterium zhairuonense]|uniref:hypothetical protein n=1 Tax=Flavobacterium zhairuonense TaxID=2493631 RepID=UPI00104DAB59|nr:hypothetical protein [Flavobacterium zhairuonense]KAF2512724.1 hypothetical protein EYY60_06345 [Flavobacterium zhairuonense]